jgi:hypothetical protein
MGRVEPRRLPEPLLKVVRVKNARGEDVLLGMEDEEVTAEVHDDLIRELRRPRPPK